MKNRVVGILLFIGATGLIGCRTGGPDPEDVLAEAVNAIQEYYDAKDDWEPEERLAVLEIKADAAKRHFQSLPAADQEAVLRGHPWEVRVFLTTYPPMFESGDPRDRGKKWAPIVARQLTLSEVRLHPTQEYVRGKLEGTGKTADGKACELKVTIGERSVSWEKVVRDRGMVVKESGSFERETEPARPRMVRTGNEK